MINTNQDSKRELRLIERFGLKAASDNSRGLIDAIDDYQNKFELKSTSKKSVSTSRDCGLAHLERWRAEYWIIGIWDISIDDYHTVYFLSPKDLEDWFITVENKIQYNVQITNKLGTNLLSKEEKTSLQRIIKRGISLNDPCIPLTYVQKHGKIIKDECDLNLLVKKNPIKKLEKSCGLELYYVN